MIGPWDNQRLGNIRNGFAKRNQRPRRTRQQGSAIVRSCPLAPRPGAGVARPCGVHLCAAKAASTWRTEYTCVAEWNPDEPHPAPTRPITTRKHGPSHIHLLHRQQRPIQPQGTFPSTRPGEGEHRATASLYSPRVEEVLVLGAALGAAILAAHGSGSAVTTRSAWTCPRTAGLTALPTLGTVKWRSRYVSGKAQFSLRSTPV